MTEEYENLANAIVLCAVKDYRQALKKLKKDPEDGYARDMAMSCERFFRSAWYTKLTQVDGVMLMESLREEAGM